MFFECGRYRLGLDAPLLMGIVNLTPDSFSGDGVARPDAGDYVAAAVAHARKQIAAGADILDLGAESSRPGAAPVTLKDELARLLPVITELKHCGVPLSVDTCKPEVMSAVLSAGADMINDISAFSAPGAVKVVAGAACGLCIMHKQGEPGTMQLEPRYSNVVAEVSEYLADRAKALVAAGVLPGRIAVDPGFGFGKSYAHNLALFRALPAISAGAYPVLVGISRKAMLGQMTGKPVDQRMPASIIAALLAAQYGARILRVHDVAATRDALNVWRALCGEEQ